MTVATLKAWVLSVLFVLAPNTPWKNTYDATATAFAKSAFSSPLYCTYRADKTCVATDEDRRRTAATYVSVGWFEGAFKQDAEGDCDKTTDQGICVKGSKPHSFCMFQIHESNFKGLGVTRERLQTDFDVCVATANRLMKQSFRICSSRPLEERLRWYAGGGNGCPTTADAGRKSQHRMKKAVWLFDHHPVPASPTLAAID